MERARGSFGQWLAVGAGVFLAALGAAGAARPGMVQVLPGRIVFERDVLGSSDLYVMDANGREQRALTRGPEEEFSPTVSAAGTVFFVGGESGSFELNVLRRGSARRLTSRGPVWEPDASLNGSRVAFTRGLLGRGEVVSVNSRGGGLVNLSRHPRADDITPALNPTGTEVVFSSNREGRYSLYRATLRGAVTKITSASDADLEPSWSPDGTRIAFTRRVGDNYDLWLVNPDGTGERRLTRAARAEFDPAWSPDGRWIAFVSGDESNYDIYVMPARPGAQAINVTRSPASDYAPDWGRNAPRAALRVLAGAGAHLQTCDVSGTGSADTLPGTPSAEVICGFGGSDTIRAGAGNDSVRGGDGNDVLYGEGGHDTIAGGSNQDSMLGGSGDDRFYALDSARDRISGGPGAPGYARDRVIYRDVGQDSVIGVP